MQTVSRLDARWRKSSHSGTSGCVEVRRNGGGVRVRDSVDPDGPRLDFAARSWNAFLRRTERTRPA